MSSNQKSKLTQPQETHSSEATSQPEAPSTKQEYGNKDADQTYKIKDQAELSQVIVRQVKVDTANGGMYEVPNTVQIQTYPVEVFEKLTEQKDDRPDFFAESKIKITILHDPR